MSGNASTVFRSTASLPVHAAGTGTGRARAATRSVEEQADSTFFDSRGARRSRALRTLWSCFASRALWARRALVADRYMNSLNMLRLPLQYINAVLESSNLIADRSIFFVDLLRQRRALLRTETCLEIHFVESCWLLAGNEKKAPALAKSRGDCAHQS